MDIGSSLVKTKSTAEDLDLMLDLHEYRKVVGIYENVTPVLEGGQQIKCLVKLVNHAVGWLPFVPYRHAHPVLLITG
ncbi:MAG TPA: hypothetical protein VHU85_04150 [Acidimicrobiales bacterium]|jgi:hypothetical protein|nr:hypothetical protein [Acidimicrobiales bacterium]